MEQVRKRLVWIALLVALLASSLVVAFYVEDVPRSAQGFRVYSIGGNTLLLSDDDVLSYNWTSQEIGITPQAALRLNQTGDLYSWTGVSVRIDGEEVYQAVFRKASMDAVPAPPRISILFPSYAPPPELANYSAIRLFYPPCQPPSDLAASNAKLLQYFQRTDRLVH